jgi:hypothetical protein
MPSKLIRVAVLGAALAGCKEKAADPPKKIEPVGQPSPDPAPAMRKPAPPPPATGSGSDTASADSTRPGAPVDRRPAMGSSGPARGPFPKDQAFEMLKKRRAAAAARAAAGSGSAAEPTK